MAGLNPAAFVTSTVNVTFVPTSGVASSTTLVSVLLGSTSGTQPGFDLRGLRLPLNPDRFLRFTFLSPNGLQFSNSAGLLDGEGRAEALLSLTPATWANLVGVHFDFVAFLGGPSPAVTNSVGFEVVP